MDCGGSINAVSLSPNQQHAAVGGRDVLKTLSLSESGEWKEGKNLRVGRKKGLDLATTDVKWHPVHANIIASGSTNGTVLTWDISRAKNVSAQEQQFRHLRTVNRVNWHATQDSWLLTGSQDGTIRLWDAKCPGTSGSAVNFVHSLGDDMRTQLDAFAITDGGHAYVPGADAVRDVQFDPFHPFQFVAALEDGSVQLWDVRQASLPTMCFTAHAGLTMCCQWHPTQPDILATGGRDRLVRIWQTGPSSNSFVYAVAANQTNNIVPTDDGAAAFDTNASVTPVAVIQTPASVSQLAWRCVKGWPSAFKNIDDIAETPAELTDASSFQLATSAALLDNNCYTWDIRHVFLPVAVFGGHKDVVTGMAWLRAPEEPAAPSWLLTVSKDSKLMVQAPSRAVRPHQQLRTVTLAFSPTELAWCHQTIERNSFWAVGTAAQHASTLESQSFKTFFQVFNTHPQVVPRLPVLRAHNLRAQARNAAHKVLHSCIWDAYDALDPPAHIFALLALQYATEGASVPLLCTHNASVAASFGLHRIAQVWRTLAVLYEYTPPPMSALSPPSMVQSMSASPNAGSAIAAIHTSDKRETSHADAAVQEQDASAELLPSRAVNPETADRALIPIISNISSVIPGYISGLLESLAAVNSQAAHLLTVDDETESVGSTGGADDDRLSRGMAESSIPSNAKELAQDVESEHTHGAPLDLQNFAEQSWHAFRDEVLLGVLDFYADMADVQTCVTISRVLGNDIERVVSKRRLQRWLVSYIDLLHRLQLWAPASTVMARATDETIRRLNQLHTAVTSSCSCCSKDIASVPPSEVLPTADEFDLDDIPNVVFATDGAATVAIVDLAHATAEDKAIVNSAACDGVVDVADIGTLQQMAPSHCEDCASNVSTCCICMQPVKGIYAWCQGCGHGGHLEHMLEWFSSVAALCPTGCMHVCDLRTATNECTNSHTFEDVRVETT